MNRHGNKRISQSLQYSHVFNITLDTLDVTSEMIFTASLSLGRLNQSLDW